MRPVFLNVTTAIVAAMALSISSHAAEREAASWDNFQVSALALRPPPKVDLPAAPPKPAVTASTISDTPSTPRRLPTPVLSLQPPPAAAPSVIHIGIGSADPIDLQRVTPSMERRLDSLRNDWAAVDARRLAEERSHEGVWNRTVRTVLPEPATYNIGHTEIGGGLPTAIRRRNPFGLLNPVFFSFGF